MMNGLLGQRADQLTGMLAERFPANKTLEQVSGEYTAALVVKPGQPVPVNQAVQANTMFVREAAAALVDDFKKVELWISLKAPPISDGNNFGAEVQSCVLAEIKEVRTAVEAFIGGADVYHKARGEGIEKLGASASTSTDTNTEKSNDEDGEGKKTSKTSSSSKTNESVKTSTPIADLAVYVVALDVKQYHTCKSQATSIRNAYLKTQVLLTKNMKKLVDPRGEGGAG